jgi:large subunit ribosomal protein L18
MSTNNPKFRRRSERVRYALKKRAGTKIRLSVFRSGMHMYAQLIDDAKGETLAAASTCGKEMSAKLKKTSNQEAAAAVGKLIAEKAKQVKVTEVYFDRGGYIFHGRVKALAEAARAGGLKF